MKAFLITSLMWLNLARAQSDETIHFKYVFSATLKTSTNDSQCQTRYLALPIQSAQSTVDSPEEKTHEVDTPHQVWIATASENECEVLRTEIARRYNQQGLTAPATFKIEGASGWETVRIGRGCPGPGCQKYTTDARLSGTFENFTLEDKYSDFGWYGHWKPAPPASTPAPRPRPHCHPMALICDE